MFAKAVTVKFTEFVLVQFPKVLTVRLAFNAQGFLTFFVHCFPSRSSIFKLYGDVTIAGEGLQNLGLCSALRAFEQ
jgi:hypothetical protein